MKIAARKKKGLFTFRAWKNKPTFIIGWSINNILFNQKNIHQLLMTGESASKWRVCWFCCRTFQPLPVFILSFGSYVFTKHSGECQKNTGWQSQFFLFENSKCVYTLLELDSTGAETLNIPSNLFGPNWDGLLHQLSVK